MKRVALVIFFCILVTGAYITGYSHGDRGLYVPFFASDEVQPNPVRDGKTLGMGIDSYIKYFNNNSEYIKLKAHYEITDDGMCPFSNSNNFLIVCRGTESSLESVSVTFRKFDADAYTDGNNAIKATIFTLTPAAKAEDYKKIYDELDLYKDVSKSVGKREAYYDGIYYYVSYEGNAVVFFATAVPFGR
jgi:hypothetical protein